MATVSGSLRFDRARTAVSSPNLEGIANVPIVLQNTATNAMLSVYTDANGGYSFINVPNGNYRIVESYGTPAVPSPGDFSGASSGAAAVGKTPPISYINNPPSGATDLDGTTQNTILVTVAGADVSGQDILNGPVKYTPIQTIMDNTAVILPENLITKADNGSFGAFPQGTPPNTGVADPALYSDVGSDFTYALPNPVGITPASRQYTIQNLMNDATANVQQTWWRIADHTTGNETGRMMLVNGDSPGDIIFQQRVAVKPNTYYLMSSWILNLAKSAALQDPKLGVRVTDSNSRSLYNATLGALIPMNADSPEWKQIGTVINSRDNTSLNLQFVSMGPEAYGNDYAIDDIALNEIQIKTYAPEKSANTSVVNEGENVIYTVTLKNEGINPLTGVTFKDIMPDGFSFVAGSVKVNGAGYPEADPDVGFSAPDIPGGKTLTVTFSAKAEFAAKVNPITNVSEVSYSYSPVAGGIPESFTKSSNKVDVTIKSLADLGIIKTADKSAVKTGDVLTYSLNVINNGPNNARNVVITDILPSDLTGAQFSIDGGMIWQAWNGSYALGSIAPQATKSILIRGTVIGSSVESITNVATAESLTPDPNPLNNSGTVTVEHLPPDIDLSIVKTACPRVVTPGCGVTYTIIVSNKGTSQAEDVLLVDTPPKEIRCSRYSLDSGRTWEIWNGQISLGNIPANSEITVLIKGTVSAFSYGELINYARVSSASADNNSGDNQAQAAASVVFRKFIC